MGTAKLRLHLGTVALALWATTGFGGCDSTSCTEATCENSALITVPPGRLTGPYNLALSADTETLNVRCNDPSSPEAAENPDGVQCDTSTISLEAIPMANQSSVFISIELADGQLVADNVEVFLDVAEENSPNGESCPPTCFVRNGQLVFP